MSTLNEMQARISDWQAKNFPTVDEWELCLGVCEEAGELAKSFLKMHRGIRAQEFNEETYRDAIGDIVVFLMGICSARGWQLSEIVTETGNRVVGRDFQTANRQRE